MDDLINFTVKTRREAEDVINSLGEVADQFGAATVADLYDLVGIVSKFTDNHFGWTPEDISHTTVGRIRSGYIIVLPKVMDLRSTQSLAEALSMGNLGKPITVKSWQLDTHNVPTGEPDITVGTLEGFWSNKDGLIIKLHGFDIRCFPKKLFRVEVYTQ